MMLMAGELLLGLGLLGTLITFSGAIGFNVCSTFEASAV
jgi:hypothetical protein